MRNSAVHFGATIASACTALSTSTPPAARCERLDGCSPATLNSSRDASRVLLRPRPPSGNRRHPCRKHALLPQFAFSRICGCTRRRPRGLFRLPPNAPDLPDDYGTVRRESLSQRHEAAHRSRRRLMEGTQCEALDDLQVGTWRRMKPRVTASHSG